MDRHVRSLEDGSVDIIREGLRQLKRPAVLWSMGKDSTTLLWLIRKAVFGQVTLPVLHIDTSYKFAEMYRFRDQLAEDWSLDLRIVRNEAALSAGMSPATASKLECCNALKTTALKSAIEQHGFDGLFLGIRGDEHGVRAKERVFSHRTPDFRWNYHDQPAEMWSIRATAPAAGKGHLRIHPLLRWSERDIWTYIESEGIPLPSLYFSKEGRRYRSIGCEQCCSPVASGAETVADVVLEVMSTRTSERAGRAQDKEDAVAMQKLRSLGYM